MDSSHKNNLLWAIARADAEPLSRRIELYRWLAEFTGDELSTSNLQALADSFERTQWLCDQFIFDFGRGGIAASRAVLREKGGEP